MPKKMYTLIFWGLVLPLLVLPAVIGWAMVCGGAWILGRYNPTFRIASIASGLLVLVVVLARFLPPVPQLSGVLVIAIIILNCLLGWFLLTSVSEDCLRHGQFDLAASARVARVIFGLIVVGAPLFFHFYKWSPPASPVLVLLPMIVPLLGYVILVWTFQSAKERLFP